MTPHSTTSTSTATPLANLSTSSSTFVRTSALTATASAHAAELDRRYSEAYLLHSQSFEIFTELVERGKKGSEERRRDKLWLRVAKERVRNLRNAVDVVKGEDGKEAAKSNGKEPLGGPVPSKITRDLELKMTAGHVGKVLLSNVHGSVWSSLSGPGHSFGGLVGSDSSFSDATQYLTPILPTRETMPDVVYHLHLDMKATLGRHYIHVLDASEVQTLYTIHAPHIPGEQIAWTYLFWLDDFNMPCASAKHDYIRLASDNHSDRFLSRGFTVLVRPLILGGGVPKADIVPEKNRTIDWTRRFEYGGMKFVWRADKDPDGEGSLKGWQSETSHKEGSEYEALYEVKSRADIPGGTYPARIDGLLSAGTFESLEASSSHGYPPSFSQSQVEPPGQEFDRKIAWTRRYYTRTRDVVDPFRMRKKETMRVMTIAMAGALDQTFREFVLVSIGAKLMIHYVGNS